MVCGIPSEVFQRWCVVSLVKYSRDGVWYQNNPLGKNMFFEMMVNISKYTNKPVRVSTVTNLFQAGMSADKMFNH